MGEAERIPLLIANAVESFEKARISNDANEISTKLQETADLLRDARNNVLVLCDDIKGKTPPFRRTMERNSAIRCKGQGTMRRT